MKKINQSAICLTICAGLVLSSIAHADSILEYLVKESRVSAATTQYVAIKNGQIMVRAAGGDKNLDLLYRQAADSVLIVDHSKRTLMTVNEQQIDRINQQARDVQPLLNGLGEQVARLSPHQRHQWQELLGDYVSLDTIAKANEPPEPTKLVPTGVRVRNVAGVRCQTMSFMQGAKPVAEVCLADAANMKISENDAATIRAFFCLYERLATKGQGLARQIGLILPNISAHQITGIPIEFKDLSKDKGSMILRRINTSTVSPETMRSPQGYKAVPLMIWP